MLGFVFTWWCFTNSESTMGFITIKAPPFGIFLIFFQAPKEANLRVDWLLTGWKTPKSWRWMDGWTANLSYGSRYDDSTAQQVPSWCPWFSKYHHRRNTQNWYGAIVKLKLGGGWNPDRKGNGYLISGKSRCVKYSSWWFQTFFVIFTPIWGDHPRWRAYFSDGLKPPTSMDLKFSLFWPQRTWTWRICLHRRSRLLRYLPLEQRYFACLFFRIDRIKHTQMLHGTGIFTYIYHEFKPFM